MIKGVVVPDIGTKEILYNRLKSVGLITQQGTSEVILGIPTEKFFHVGTHFTQEMVSF